MNNENRRTIHKVKITSHLSGLCAHPTDEVVLHLRITINMTSKES